MEIPLTKNKVALIDEEDFPLISPYNWYALEDKRLWYAIAIVKRKTIRMHRLILNFPPCDIDHVNSDGLDNRRANLRLATIEQNHANRRKTRGVSQYKGVWRHKNGKWMAQIKRRYLGSFQHEEDAARAYDAAALVEWGAFARVNFPCE